MDLKITPEVLARMRDKDSKKERFRSLYEQAGNGVDGFLTAYAKHTDLRVRDNPKGSIGREDEWESHGKLQLAFLVDEGMRPHHHLLDVGCGVGRGARKFVPYLAPGHYVGVDISREALNHAIELSESEGWVSKQPTFMWGADLDLNREFDFIFAHSVFTHLPPQQIALMIANAAQLLPVGGRFCFTYKHADRPHRSGLKQFQMSAADFAKWSKPHGFKCEPLDKVWPAHQLTIRLTKL